MNSKTKKKYVDMLKNNDVSMEEIMQITVKYVPERLFRYMGFGEYWKNNLINGEIHLSKPKEFNDPFDSLVCYKKEEILKNYEEALNKNWFLYMLSKINSLVE